MPGWMAAMQSPLGYGSIQNNLDFSGAPAMPQVNMDVLNNSIKARYGEGAQYLDPQFSQGQQALDSTLANQGIVRNPGDPNSAWGKEQTNFGNTRQKAYSDLMQNSITGGMEDMQKYFGMGLQARQQGVGEAAAKGAFANQAQNQGFNQNVQQHTLPADLLSKMFGMTNPNVPQFQGTSQSPYVQAAGLQGQLDAANKNAKTGLNSSIVGGLASIFAQNPGLLSSLPAGVANSLKSLFAGGGGGGYDPSQVANPVYPDTSGQLTFDPNTGMPVYDGGGASVTPDWTSGYDVPSQDWSQWIPQG
jgi:hypothetical protein